MCGHAHDSGAAALTTDAVPSSGVADPTLFCVGAVTLCGVCCEYLEQRALAAPCCYGGAHPA